MTTSRPLSAARAAAALRFIPALLVILAATSPALAAAPPPPLKPQRAVALVVAADDPAAATLAAVTVPEAARGGVALLIDLPNPADPAPRARAAELAAEATRNGWLTGVWWNAWIADPASHETEVAAQVEALRALVAPGGDASTGARIVVVDFAAPAPQAADPAPGTPESAAASYAYLLKRLSAAAHGAAADVRVLSAPVDAARAALLAPLGLGSYWDMPLARGRAAAETVDAGRTFALATEILPGSGPEQVAMSWLRGVDEGARLVLMRAPGLGEPAATAEILARTVAHIAGDIDKAHEPLRIFGEGNATLPVEAHAYVRGEDLATLVVVGGTAAGSRALEIGGTAYTGVTLVNATSGRSGTPQAGPHRNRTHYVVALSADGAMNFVRLGRAAADASAQSVQLEVSTERGLSAEEIIARHQAFQSAHDARLDTFTAINTTSMRFRVGDVRQTFESTIRGQWLYRRNEGFEWVWEQFFINGVKWRGRNPPELPLLQPEKVTTLPLGVNFGTDYRYELTGEETIDGFAAYVLEFVPAPGTPAGVPLYRGRVWIEKGSFARLRSTVVQLNLSGEVVSNEEISDYRPTLAVEGAAAGTPVRVLDAAAWASAGAARTAAYWLPLHVRGEQIFATAGRSTAVERETNLADVVVNRPDYDAHRAAVLASESTIVKDTARGMRYFAKDDAGVRQIKEETNKRQLFAAAGGFYDDSLDFPLPFLGVNYFDFDFRGHGLQTNVFFALAILTATVADPSLAGTRWDAGVDLFAVAVPFGDTLYVDGQEAEDQKVNVLPSSVGLRLGHPLGNFGKATLTYGARYDSYQRHEDTASEFVVPENTLTQTADLSLSWARRGWSLTAGAEAGIRNVWEPWGLPGNPDYHPDRKNFTRWQAGIAKDFHLPWFQKLHIDAAYRGSSSTDRFSKYSLGFFGGNQVHGFKSNSVRAETLALAHVSYGFNIANVVRLEAFYDSAWAKDELIGLDWDQFHGVGLGGTLMGPWSTIVNFDFGVPINSDQDGFVVNLVLLKLF